MKARIRHGGLLRCCLQTWAFAHDRGALPSEPGATLDCIYEQPGNARMRLAPDGVWEWNDGKEER